MPFTELPFVIKIFVLSSCFTQVIHRFYCKSKSAILLIFPSDGPQDKIKINVIQSLCSLSAIFAIHVRHYPKNVRYFPTFVNFWDRVIFFRKRFLRDLMYFQLFIYFVTCLKQAHFAFYSFLASDDLSSADNPC